jgi:sec-independent protein translocase protein TatA
MPNVGPLELAIVLIIALVVFGPKRLPELGKSVGRGIREFKGSISGENDDDDEPKSPTKIEPAKDSAQPPPPPGESAEAAKADEGTEAGKADETVVHDRG